MLKLPPPQCPVFFKYIPLNCLCQLCSKRKVWTRKTMYILLPTDPLSFASPTNQDRHTDQLQRPKHFPEPVTQYTLKEITVVWHLYGGRDFGPPPHDSSSSTPSPGSSPLIIRRGSKDGSRPVTPIRTSGTNGARGLGSGTSPVTPRKYSTSPKSSSPFVAFGGVSKTKGRRVAGGKKPGGTQDWKTAGGPGRDHDILMELELDKVTSALP